MTVPVSGERLAREMGISHSRMVRLVNKLRIWGVDILGEPFTGFRLNRLPEVLLPQMIRERLHSGDIGRPVHHLYRVDSTNAFALGLVLAGAASHGAVVVAEEQTSGRGRRGRRWCSEAGSGLYLSLVLEPDIPCSLAPLLALGAAVAAHESIERITGLDVDVKWPNDLLVDRRKIGGILAELQAEPDQIRSMVLGVGINVNQDRFPQELQGIASSLNTETGQRQSRLEILTDFLGTFERLYLRFVRNGPGEIIRPWLAASSFASGKTIEIDDGMRRIRGVTDGLSALGALRVREHGDRVSEVFSGDVLDWE